MKRFITPEPMPERRGRASPLDPVLSGVAQGLARLFPAVEPTRSSGTPAPGGLDPDPAHPRDGDRTAVWVGSPTDRPSDLRSADGAKA